MNPGSLLLNWSNRTNGDLKCGLEPIREKSLNLLEKILIFKF